MKTVVPRSTLRSPKWRPFLNWITFPTSMSSCNDQKVLFGSGASFEDSQPDNMPKGLEPYPDLCRRDQVGHIRTVSLWQYTDPVLCDDVFVSGWQEGWENMVLKYSMNHSGYRFKSSAKVGRKYLNQNKPHADALSALFIFFNGFNTLLYASSLLVVQSVVMVHKL